MKPQTAEDPARQGGLAGAEVAAEVNDETGAEMARQVGAESERCRFVGKMAGDHGLRSVMDFNMLAADIKRWGEELGFQRLGIADCDLSQAEARLAEWLERGWQGDMDYMSRHGTKRARPAELIPGTVRVI